MKKYKAFKLSFIAVFIILSVPMYLLLAKLLYITGIPQNLLAPHTEDLFAGLNNLAGIVKTMSLLIYAVHIIIINSVVYMYMVSGKFDFSKSGEASLFVILPVIGLLPNIFIVRSNLELLALVFIETLLVLAFASAVSIQKYKKQKVESND